MSKVRHLERDDEFDNLIKEAGSKLVVVDFFATWCGPCKMIGPQFENLSSKYDNVVFVKIDVDKLEGISTRYNISAMPTFIALKNGQKVGEVVGANIGTVEELINKNK
ncbi:unnamed protein product [Trichobilharzia regenti]|uniref:Thioredoxin n=1 Tax=Trichobilharzia regenti TaxID=157069 RepID=A0A183WKA9_TRIRE|nr:unnamed protein product [Trichobilharzia regenti]VDQ08442.1 unnamed protein product [Trichobilharzia regenti]